MGMRQQATVGQGSLLDIVDRQFAQAFGGGDPAIQNSENPFRKQFGECVIPHDGRPDARLYWCHRCGKKFCWECFQQHSD